MKTLTRSLIGTAAALAVVAGGTASATAQEHGRDRGLSTGEVMAGALIIGGIAAVAASAANRDRDYRDDGYHYDRDYRGGSSGWYDYNPRASYRGNNPDRAVQQCIRAAERQAERWGGGRAEVTQIRDVDRERGGFEVRGRIAVRSYNNRGGSWNNYRSGYRNNGFEEGRFTCEYRRGRVTDVRLNGLRNLR